MKTAPTAAKLLKSLKKREKVLSKLKKIRGEQAAERKKERRKIHAKEVRSRVNRRYYLKRTEPIRRYHEEIGDVFATFHVFIARNGRRIKKLGIFKWKSSAYEAYNSAVEENEKNVKFPVYYECSSSGGHFKHKRVIYEIILAQRVFDDDEAITQFRDGSGRFLNVTIVCNDARYKILAKQEWRVDESFYVYGYHPKRGRKNFDFILNEIVLKNLDRENSRRIFVYKNKLFVQYDSDFDFVVCKNNAEALRLYDTLEKWVKSEYVMFTGQLSDELRVWILNQLYEKTGWDEKLAKKTVFY